MNNKIKVLSELVLKFAAQAAPQTACVITTPDGESEQFVDGELKPVYLNVEDTLAMWMQLPDCAYNSMFVGWCIGRGHDIREFTPIDVERAVCVALTGGGKNVIQPWMGDNDGTQKPS